METNNNSLELLQSLENCNEDLEAIYIEVFSLRLELKALKEKVKEMRRKFQVINYQLPAVKNESELYP